MSSDLEGRAFVVCGADRGLGRAVAAALASEGSRVLLAGRRADELEEVAAELGTGAYAFACKLSRPEETYRLAATVPLTLGRIDGAFVDGGRLPRDDVLELEDEDWLEAFDVLIGRPARLVRSLAPLLGGEGAFVLASPPPDSPSAAVLEVLRPGASALVKTLAGELAPAVRVNSLAPVTGTDSAETRYGSLAASLLSPAAAVTGATLSEDDGAVWETA